MADLEKDIPNHIAPRDPSYLYLGSISEARRNNELDDWRESHKQNILDKQHLPAWAQGKLAELRPTQQEQSAAPGMGGMTME